MENTYLALVVAKSVADVRRDPDPDSELVTQALMNTPVHTGNVSGAWTHVTLIDYSGWMRMDDLEEPIVKGFCEGDVGTCGIPLPYSAVVSVPHTPLYSSETGTEAQGELYLSTALPFINLEHQHRLRVALPGDREAWLVREAIAICPNSELFPTQPVQVVSDYAVSFLGISYLWGGTSWLGIDCSAFVQLCHRMGGYCLPRDADQQYDALETSVPREQMQEGDLIFFGRQRITHVALALNRYEYIHAEGDNFERVIIHSLDPAHPAYYGYLSELVWGIKRVRDSAKIKV